MPAALYDFFRNLATPGFRLMDGSEMGKVISLVFGPPNAGLTALAGGAQAGATALVNGINEVSTVATTADSVLLPLALPGAWVIVINSGANSAQVFGQPTNPNTNAGDTIAAHNSVSQTATGTGVAQASAAVGVYYCFSPGKWKQTLLT